MPSPVWPTDKRIETLRRVARCIAVASAALLCATLLSSPAHACTCKEGSLAQSFAQATHVLAVQVLERGDTPGAYRFGVLEYFKRDDDHVGELRTDSVCGYAFTPGHRYLVFALRDGPHLLTGHCAGNRSLADADSVLPWLRDQTD